ncbi:MAG TPA: ThiF family adenylyltransferase [Candidatus Anammoximicrobium sp.]|nr:ThiF family adenylyltransferase [Candidatus Anammoximicrobium sp.]
MNPSDQLDYARQQGAAGVELLRRQHVVVVGIGSASTLVKTFARMGMGKITAIDPDVVEFRNVTSQGYRFEDARKQRPKVEALRDECLAINPDLRFLGLQEDFVSLPDGQLKTILADATLLVMTTDHHPAQARGNLAGLVCDVPVLFGSLYRRGRAGEIILQYPGLTRACYRCITRDRYQYVARQQTGGTGNGTGSLPFAPLLVDSILGFLAVGVLHRRHGATDNPYAAWIDRVANRGFIQTRMDPDYRLGEEDIFGDVFGHGEKVFCFDTIWQPAEPEVQANCPDCHGQGAIPVGQRHEESTELQQLACGCLVQRRSTPWSACPACHALASTSSQLTN